MFIFALFVIILLLLKLSFSYRPAQAVKILVALAVFCTFGLQFYVCVEIGWNSIKDKFVKRPTLVNYVMRYIFCLQYHLVLHKIASFSTLFFFRTVLVTAAVVLAVAVPTISPFIGLIGAFCFSILGLLVPV